jgi:uncharacterized DUF497 family protein
VYTKVYMTQRFTWSEAKRQRILAERGFDLLRAARIFRGPVMVTEDVRHDYRETRYIALGVTEGESFTVVFTPRQDQRRQDPQTGEDVLHLVTAWRMGRRARRRYQQRHPR